MSQVISIFNRIAPIILLLIIGKWIHKKAFLSEETVLELKKLVVNFALPAILFIAFFNVNLQLVYIWFVPIIMGICLALFLLGTIIQKSLDIKGEYFPFLITGFEYGMIGVSLFGTAYGLDQLGKIAIIDFGQEVFVWFIYMALLTRKNKGGTNMLDLIKMFASSPVIIAIFAGIILNLLKLPEMLDVVPFAEGIIGGVELLGSLTVPLILIVIGYGIQIDRQEFAYSAMIILIRLVVNIPVAILLNRFVIGGLLGLDKGFQAAFFTMLILPPPYILTLFMKQDLVQERSSINNTLTLHTISTICVFIVYFALNPAI